MGEVNGVEISNIFGLEKPLSKLIDTIKCGIGKLYEPTHIKRMAQAKAEEIEAIGEAVSKNLSLPTKYDGGKILIDATSAEELICRAKNRFLFQEIRKQQNIDSVIAETYKQLENEEEVSSEPVDKDWVSNFFDSVGNISDEKMQILWSKILAGEIKNPNTYSIRVLNTLKNMTQHEAKIFEKISKFKILSENIPFILNDDEILKKYNCNFDDLLKMEECGLINSRGFLTANIKKNEDGKVVLCTDKVIAFIYKDISLSAYPFTESGKQLLKILETNTNYEYTIEVLRKIKAENKNCEVKAYKVNNFDYSKINYDKSETLLI